MGPQLASGAEIDQPRIAPQRLAFAKTGREEGTGPFVVSWRLSSRRSPSSAPVIWQARRNKPALLDLQGSLWATLERLLREQYFPEQIAGILRNMNSVEPTLRASDETIYTVLYVLPCGQCGRICDRLSATGPQELAASGSWRRSSSEQDPNWSASMTALLRSTNGSSRGTGKAT
ncbi:MAG: hypothetical protein VB125_00010 [Burkholderia sp.]